MNTFDISILEQALRKILLDGKVSEKVYGNRPKAVDGPSSDFIVATIAGSIEDQGTYGECLTVISLFALNSTIGKNAAKLSIMQKRLLDCMPTSYEVKQGDEVVASFEFDNKPTIIGDNGDDFGYHCRIIQFQTIIKVL